MQSIIKIVQECWSVIRMDFVWRNLPLFDYVSTPFIYPIPPNHLCSEISLSRTCNIPNLKLKYQ